MTKEELAALALEDIDESEDDVGDDDDDFEPFQSGARDARKTAAYDVKKYGRYVKTGAKKALSATSNTNLQ